METRSFDYIADHNSRVLILGTMPGKASIDSNEYYGHPDNLFWDIIFRICHPDWKCDEVVSVDYETKKQTIQNNHIALWDVLQYCEREGSLDKNIRNQIHNDFKIFFQSYPSIRTIFFNGQKASKYFDEFRPEPTIFDKRTFITLQSTSPSNTINSFYKLKEWMQIKDFINLY